MSVSFSVLMSLYNKEKPEYVRSCFESLLGQTYRASEWIVVEDGPLTNDLYDLLDDYEKKFPMLIKRVPLAKNVGLGNALAEGIKHCSFELIARMDTDDISRSDRFEKQINLFLKHPDLDICGSHILEFEGEIDNIIAKRKVPIYHKDIVKYQKRRDAFNHVTVMFKKSSVLKAGNYQSCLLMEDTLLWVKMILNGAKCANIDDYLVFVRIGKDMYERRGGISYYKKYKAGRKKVLETGFITKWDYAYTLLLQFVIALMPNCFRGLIFKKMLHR